MREYKKDPLRSRARRDIIRALGEKEIINRLEIVSLTDLSPLTVNSILREFRNYKIITCHAGGLYALSGEGRECYIQLMNDKKYRKLAYEERMKAEWAKQENERKSIYIEDKKEEDED
ncbi:MAG: hypothetical protein ACTSO7_00550 [Candidatus Heimdallarchaeota archaeon]